MRPGLLVAEVSCDRCCRGFQPPSNRGFLRLANGKLSQFNWSAGANEEIPAEQWATILEELVAHVRERALEEGWERRGNDLVCSACREEMARPKCSCGRRAESTWKFCAHCGLEVQWPEGESE